jgi:hypothetical protein
MELVEVKGEGGCGCMYGLYDLRELENLEI